ncbi:lipocalin-like domain-containing protein [Vibrio sonorensis]|uniref:lipocalin-like domain-containing protein n=1 Tax=Vibrio sonorensis TaxID=1004316 RepID=UPI0008D96C78|nr:lipocalin-like domain-containing protein [Vibrio sonorensis]
MITKQQLLGEWRLIDAEMTVSGNTSKTFDSTRKMVKLFTESHFSFYSKTEDRPPFSAEVTDEERLQASKTLDVGGGTYKLEENRYTENVVYCSYPNYEGKSITFDLTLEGDTLIQQGDYPLKELGFAEEDGYVREVYKKLS